MFERENIIGENNDLIISPLMIADQELTGTEFVWIHHVKKLREGKSSSKLVNDSKRMINH